MIWLVRWLGYTEWGTLPIRKFFGIQNNLFSFPIRISIWDWTWPSAWIYKWLVILMFYNDFESVHSVSLFTNKSVKLHTMRSALRTLLAYQKISFFQFFSPFFILATLIIIVVAQEMFMWINLMKISLLRL